MEEVVVRSKEVVMDLRFYDIVFTLRSPAIVTKRLTERGFLSPLNYIPATTLRGALISALYGMGAVDRDFIDKESKEPRFIASPAYPYAEGRKSYPCHPFAYECKVVHGETIERVNYASEAVDSIERGDEPEFRMVCTEGHAALDIPYSRPIIPDDGGFLTVSLPSHGAVCVGISKNRASSQRGMLYEYEALPANAQFWATVAIPDEVEVKQGMIFHIGRGVSRGFGEAQITEVKEIGLEKLAQSFSEALKGRYIALYSQSFCVWSNGSECRPYPKEIDLHGSVLSWFGLDVREKCTLEIVKAYGRTSQLHTGWDIARNIEKPMLTTASQPGTVFLAKLKRENCAKALAALSLVGTIEPVGWYGGEHLYITGVNMLTPLRTHPLVGGD